MPGSCDYIVHATTVTQGLQH